MFETTYTNSRMRFTPGAGTTEAEVYLYGAWVDSFNEKPSIVICADDGHETFYDSGLPLVERYGMRASLGYVHDWVGDSGYMTVAEWSTAISNGHEANVHGPKSGKSSLRDYFADFTGYDSAYAAILADIEYNRDGLRAAGLAANNSDLIYVYPQGFFRHASDYTNSDILDAVLEAGMIGGRIASFQGSNISDPIGWNRSRYLMPILGHTWNYSSNETNNIADLSLRIQREIADGHSVILMFHKIAASPDASEEITAENLKILLEIAAELIADGAAENRTLSEHINYGHRIYSE